VRPLLLQSKAKFSAPELEKLLQGNAQQIEAIALAMKHVEENWEESP
jgi:hypothetical protein